MSKKEKRMPVSPVYIEKSRDNNRAVCIVALFLVTLLAAGVFFLFEREAAIEAKQDYLNGLRIEGYTMVVEGMAVGSVPRRAAEKYDVIIDSTNSVVFFIPMQGGMGWSMFE